MLKHSDYQVLAIAGPDLLATQRLKRRAAKSAFERLSTAEVDTHDLHVRVPIGEISHVVADKGLRRLVVLTPDREMHFQGFPRSARSWFNELSGNRNSPPAPMSPVASSAEQIAKAAGLQLATEKEAEVLHFGAGQRSSTGSLTSDIGVLRLRHWRPALMFLLRLVSVLGFFLLLSTVGESDGLPMGGRLGFGLAILVAMTLGGVVLDFAIPIQVGPKGIRGPWLLRGRHVDWSDVQLVHGVDAQQGLVGRRYVQVACAGDRKIMLDLTRSQVERLAAAVERHGSPLGVAHQLHPGDFSRRYGTTQELVPSAIAIRVFGFRF